MLLHFTQPRITFAKSVAGLTWLMFIVIFALTIVYHSNFLSNHFSFFIFDPLSWVMANLILFVSANVQQYSLRYMAGDRLYSTYYFYLLLITFSALIMVIADNLIILLLAWGTSNLLLTRLMIHKFSWKAAKQSGILTLKYFVFGF